MLSDLCGNYLDCGDHFTTYIFQIIMLYTLNTYNYIWQLFLNKTGKIQ